MYSRTDRFPNREADFVIGYQNDWIRRKGEWWSWILATNEESREAARLAAEMEEEERFEKLVAPIAGWNRMEDDEILYQDEDWFRDWDWEEKVERRINYREHMRQLAFRYRLRSSARNESYSFLFDRLEISDHGVSSCKPFFWPARCAIRNRKMVSTHIFEVLDTSSMPPQSQVSLKMKNFEGTSTSLDEFIHDGHIKSYSNRRSMTI